MKVAVVEMRIAAHSPDTANRSSSRPRPTVIVNPPDDREFRALIERILLAEAIAPTDLQAALRVQYPATVVRRRELTGERVDVWYVYRDGRWIRSHPDAP